VPLPAVNTLWIGDGLGPVERACLRSAMAQGHRVRLFCYDRLSGIPQGVEVEDAEQILPRTKIVHYASGSVSLFSNYFRYALQREGLGLWADTDHYFLKPHDFVEPYIYGRNHLGRISSGVLRIPSDSPLLAALLALFENPVSVPAWLPKPQQRRAQLLIEEHGRLPYELLGWGVTGPRALTWWAEKLELSHWAKAKEVFYPTDFDQSDWIVDPAMTLESFLAPNTVSLHLYNEKIKQFKNDPAPPGSFLARLHDEGR